MCVYMCVCEDACLKKRSAYKLRKDNNNNNKNHFKRYNPHQKKKKLLQILNSNFKSKNLNFFRINFHDGSAVVTLPTYLPHYRYKEIKLK